MSFVDDATKQRVNYRDQFLIFLQTVSKIDFDEVWIKCTFEYIYINTSIYLQNYMNWTN